MASLTFGAGVFELALWCGAALIWGVVFVTVAFGCVGCGFLVIVGPKGLIFGLEERWSL